MERIKVARQKKGISQLELAKELNVTQQAISYYENGSRIPDEKTLDRISRVLNVPVEYLTEQTDDPDGWDIWEEYTGYSIKEIKDEIKRIKESHHIIGDEHDLQNLIAQAVDNLEGMGNTDKGIINSIYYGISSLQQELSKKYEDPKKLDQLSKETSLKIRPANQTFFYDDLSPEAYYKVNKILDQARYDLDKISKDLKLR
jgi:Predicted transcription factor, homolog of eukaryotic MBF1